MRIWTPSRATSRTFAASNSPSPHASGHVPGGCSSEATPACTRSAFTPPDTPATWGPPQAVIVGPTQAVRTTDWALEERSCRAPRIWVANHLSTDEGSLGRWLAGWLGLSSVRSAGRTSAAVMIGMSSADSYQAAHWAGLPADPRHSHLAEQVGDPLKCGGQMPIAGPPRSGLGRTFDWVGVWLGIGVTSSLTDTPSRSPQVSREPHGVDPVSWTSVKRPRGSLW